MNKKQIQKNLNLLDWYDSLVFALAFVVLLFAFCVRVITVNGSSMNNTLAGGDRMLVQSILYTPEYGDVVVTDSFISHGKPLVKRVIALGGDVVDFDEQTGVLSVNGTALDEPYLPEQNYTTGDIEYPYTVPEGTVFLAGDNRNNSKDSRFQEVGPIDERDILGKAFFRVFPFNKIGKIQ